MNHGFEHDVRLLVRRLSIVGFVVIATVFTFGTGDGGSGTDIQSEIGQSVVKDAVESDYDDFEAQSEREVPLVQLSDGCDRICLGGDSFCFVVEWGSSRAG